MLQFLKREANLTYTENGAPTHISTYSHCLDLFATIGALRLQSEAAVLKAFDRAYIENPDLAMKTLFFARDVRGGLGERRVFRSILRHLGDFAPESAKKNIAYVAEYGRFDDLLILLDTSCRGETMAYLKAQLIADLKALEGGEPVSLLGKWLPSVNASNKETVRLGKVMAKGFGLSEKEYRKALALLRRRIDIVENHLRERDYSFNYEKQPSKALFKYREAFNRNDGIRYGEYLSKVQSGEANMNSSALLPYEIIRPLFHKTLYEVERKSLDLAWRSLPDFTLGKNALVVVDGSGSMYVKANPIPATVALSLGIYFGERNTGAFKNHFITFSRTPQLVEIKGRDITEKVVYCSGFNEVANTDISKVFRLVLDSAVKNNLPQEDLPETLYIISDMEFDACVETGSLTNFEVAKSLFESKGYKLPQVVFWNVAARNRQQPVTRNQQGAILVSGASPAVFSMITSGDLTPLSFMMTTLGKERYAKIVA